LAEAPVTLIGRKNIIKYCTTAQKHKKTFASSIVVLTAFPQFKPSADGNMASGDVVNGGSGCGKWRTNKNIVIRNSNDMVMAQ
jgi:hypothetical protein